MSTERIKISVDITAEFWDQPPMVDVFIDGICIGQHVIDSKKYHIEHEVLMRLDANHKLQLKRYNKSDDQCKVVDGEQKDQYIILDRICIDGIDIQNLVWSRGWYEPDYPMVWKQQQELAGTVLESKIIGETWLSHNGMWNFDFFSPFYKFVISQFKH